MDFKTLSAARYSLRKFSSRPVGQEELDLILEAGRNAPTAHNYQPQRIFVLRSPEALEKIDACTGSRFHPPVMLVVAYDASVSWKRETDGKDHGEIDAAIAAAQMMLQAADLGLGTTYVGMFEPDKVLAAFRGLRRRARIPPGSTRTAGPSGSWCSICDPRGKRKRRPPRGGLRFSFFTVSSVRPGSSRGSSRRRRCGRSGSGGVP